MLLDCLLKRLAAAAAAKSLQLCPTLCNPIDSSPPGSPVPGILQARILEWVAISFSNAWKWKRKVKLLSHVQFLATPWTVAHRAPPSMGFSRQEYWSGVPLPSPLKRLNPSHFFHQCGKTIVSIWVDSTVLWWLTILKFLGVIQKCLLSLMQNHTEAQAILQANCPYELTLTSLNLGLSTQ